MTASIDKKIVEMAFQNDNFEKNVGTSLSTLDKLKRALNFGDAGKSFDGITKAAGNVNLQSIADGVNHISSKFSAMGILAITTLANIANSAIQTGVRITKALTVDPIKAGLDEYELKLNSVQTILANTEKEGTTLDTVTKALDELNEFSDKTIYNFSQMTKNVGTFTAAGVKLETSVQAIKGIANLAAISGSNADQASNAMYQLSQALAAGSVKLMDWNSIVNAGMGGQVFQESLKETARLHGVAIDQMIEDQGSFRNTLEKGWLTSDILTETLQKFTGDLNADQLRTMGYSEDQIASILKLGKTANDAATKVKTFSQLFSTLKEAAQSGWAKTFELIIGDFEEARTFLTDLSSWFGGILNASADARNEMVQGWSDLGGRTKLIEAFQNSLNAIVSVVNPIKEAMREIFPPLTAKTLFDITENIRKLTANLIVSSETADKIKRIFKGLFAVLDIGRMALVTVAKAVFGFGESLGAPINNLVDFLAAVGDFLVGLRDSIKTTDAFGVGLDKISKVLSSMIGGVKNFVSSFVDGISAFKGIKLDGLASFMENLKLRFEPLTQLAHLTGKFLNLVGTFLSKVAPIVVKLSDVVATSVGSFIDRLLESLENFQPERIFDIINGGLLGGVLLAIRQFINKGSGMFDGIAGILNGVKGSLEAWQASLKADVLLKIAAALGILTLAIIALSMIDSVKLTSALTAMTIMFVELGASLAVFQSISSTVNPLEMGKMAVGLLAVSTAILIIASALTKISKLKPEELTRGLIALGALVGIVRVSSNTLAVGSRKMIAGAAALVIFSLAIRSLTVAVRKLGELDVDDLTKGLIGVGVLVTELAIFLKATDLSGLGLLKSVGILVLAGAMNLLAIAVEKLAEIDSDKITQGLIAVGVIFGEITAFMALTGGGSTLILTAAGVTVISVAMVLLAGVMERLANLSWEGVAKGLVAMGGALAIIAAAAVLIPPTLIIQAAGLVVMAGALVILSKAMTTFGGMSWDEVATGLVALGGSLLVLAVGMAAMSGSIAGAAAIFVASLALLALAPALKLLGSMSLQEIGKGLLALAGVFVVLGAAGAVLTPVIPTLLALGVAMGIVGVAMLAAGAGILAFSAGMAALAVSGAAGASALVIIISSIVGLVPMLVKTLGRAILALVDVLVAGAPTLLEGIVTLLNILLDGLIEVLPKVIDVIITLVDSLLSKLAEKVPDFVVAGNAIIISLLKGIEDNVEDITIIAVGIMTKFLTAISQELPVLVNAGFNLIIAWIDAMSASVEENMPRLAQSVQQLGLAIVKGFLTGLIQSHKDARSGIIELAKVVIDGFKSYLGIASPSTVFMALALQVIQGLVLGIRNNAGQVVAQIVELGNRMIQSVKEKIGSMGDAGRDLVVGLANGIRALASQAINAARSLAQSVMNTITNVFDAHSPSRKTFGLGGDLDQGLANGIVHFAGRVVDATKDLGTSTLSEFSNVIANMTDSINSNVDINPTIRPVMDLSDIEAGGSQIDNLLGGKALNLSVSSIKASKITGVGQTTSQEINSQDTGTTTPSIQFTQINNSPKALSRIEIYRQTKNQLSAGKTLAGI